MEKIKIVALVGKSASGKTTLLNELLKVHPDIFNRIEECTTRPMRENESEGNPYHFITVKQYTQKLLNGELIDTYLANGDWYYGHLRESLAINKPNIGIFTLSALDCLLDDSPYDVDVYYITCPKKTRLLRMLKREDNPDVDEIVRRYQSDEKDFQYFEVEDENRLCNAGPQFMTGAIYKLARKYGQN